MRPKLKQLGKDSLVYGLGEVLSRGFLFLLLPVYTRIFSPAEYGTIEMLVMLNNFLGVLLICGMDGAQSFYFFDQKSKGLEQQKQVVSAIFQWKSIWGSLLIACALLGSPILNKHLFQQTLSPDYFVFAFIGIFFAQYVGQVSEIFRLTYKSLRFVGITLGYVVFWSLLSILFVVYFGWGIKGYFMGYCFGGFLVALVGCWTVREYLDLSTLYRQWWPTLLKFGSPLVLSGVGMYALNTTDRWFILKYHGQHELGIYALGAKFVILLLFAVNAFRAAWIPIGNEALHSEDGPELYRLVSKYYLGLTVIGVIVITALSPFLMKVFSSKLYYEAYPLVGILSWYAVFYGLFAIFCGGIWKKKKTLWSSFAMIAAAVLNIALDWCFVPRFGGVGAAVATAISFFFWNVIALVMSERLWRVHYPLRTLGFQIAVGVLFCWGILLIYARGFSVWYVFLSVMVTIFLLLRSMLGDGQLKNIVCDFRLKLLSFVR